MSKSACFMTEGSRSDDDRISHLPDNILQHILSYLPLMQAAQTSILSRKWMYLWTRITSIYIDERISSRKNSNYLLFTEKASPSLLMNVLIALICHTGANIQNFELKVNASNEHFGSYGLSNAYDQFIQFAMRKNVQELSLDFYVDKDRVSYINHRHGYSFHSYDLCMQPFTSNSLRKLSIKDCNMKLSSTLDVRFLETLWLTRVNVMEERIENLPHLISRCPLLKNLGLEGNMYWGDYQKGNLQISCPCLESLTWKCCHRFSKIEIDALCLKSFEFKGCLEKSFKLHLINTTDMDHAKVCFCKKFDTKRNIWFTRFKEFIDNFRCAKFLIIQFDTIEDFSLTRDLTEDLPPILNQLQRLELSGELHDRNAIIALANLLRSASRLEHLSISLTPDDIKRYRSDGKRKAPHYCDWNPDEGVLLDLHKFPINCVRNHLKKIEITNFTGYNVETILVKYLLQNAMMLKVMTIKADRLSFSHHLKIKRQLLNWQVNPQSRITYC